jgi:hypothetical protein
MSIYRTHVGFYDRFEGAKVKDGFWPSAVPPAPSFSAAELARLMLRADPAALD